MTSNPNELPDAELPAVAVTVNKRPRTGAVRQLMPTNSGTDVNPVPDPGEPLPESNDVRATDTLPLPDKAWLAGTPGPAPPVSAESVTKAVPPVTATPGIAGIVNPTDT
jgi:hypothetical protein